MSPSASPLSPSQDNPCPVVQLAAGSRRARGAGAQLSIPAPRQGQAQMPRWELLGAAGSELVLLPHSPFCHWDGGDVVSGWRGGWIWKQGEEGTLEPPLVAWVLKECP